MPRPRRATRSRRSNRANRNATRESTMEIYPAGSRPTRRAPAENFTGTVWQDPVISAPAPARVVINRVAFEPGARTACHTHPYGQTLYVISGVGRFQTKGQPS